eukprot:TRINITY_DN1324_c0_g1_i1.p1 TRINITY_DN1324_c0_g1~~TRINITY_DN1324_c0_g1_i1.p1  ORF type:complete len:528 (-),score=103.33 TRINITY_DN1324_c0_g1_i1:10-1593(-)
MNELLEEFNDTPEKNHLMFREFSNFESCLSISKNGRLGYLMDKEIRLFDCYQMDRSYNEFLLEETDENNNSVKIKYEGTKYHPSYCIELLQRKKKERVPIKFVWSPPVNDFYEYLIVLFNNYTIEVYELSKEVSRFESYQYSFGLNEFLSDEIFDVTIIDDDANEWKDRKEKTLFTTLFWNNDNGNHHLFIGTFFGYLYEVSIDFDTKQAQFINLINFDSPIMCIHETNDFELFVSTYEGIYMCNKERKIINSCEFDGNRFVNPLRVNNLWYFTSSNELYYFDDGIHIKHTFTHGIRGIECYDDRELVIALENGEILAENLKSSEVDLKVIVDKKVESFIQNIQFYNGWYFYSLRTDKRLERISVFSSLHWFPIIFDSLTTVQNITLFEINKNKLLEKNVNLTLEKKDFLIYNQLLAKAKDPVIKDYKIISELFETIEFPFVVKDKCIFCDEDIILVNDIWTCENNHPIDVCHITGQLITLEDIENVVYCPCCHSTYLLHNINKTTGRCCICGCHLRKSLKNKSRLS